jgi:hypothetical protein
MVLERLGHKLICHGCKQRLTDLNSSKDLGVIW